MAVVQTHRGKGHLLVLIAWLLPAMAGGMDAGEMTLRVTEELTAEYAGCATYYAILSRSAQESKDSIHAADYAALEYKAILFARAFARRARSDADARSLVTGKIDAAIASQFAAMGGDVRLVRVLSGKYALQCRHALEDPSAFADEVLTRSIR